MDTSVFHAINNLAGHIDQVDDVFEFLARSGPLLLIGLAIGMWFWPGSRAARDVRQWACITAAASGALALGINQVIIRIWERPRPFADLHAVLLLKPSPDPSFPSDHATFCFAVATALFMANRRVGLVAVLVAALVSFARVYVGEHYVGDVLAGAAIGGVTAWVVYQCQPLVMPVLEPPLRLARRFHLA